MSKKRRAKEKVPVVEEDSGKTTEPVIKEVTPVQTIENYQCTGNVQVDFPALCTFLDLKEIPTVLSTEVDDETTDVVENEHFCTTPCLIVKLENKNPQSATKLKISGWKVTQQIFRILQIMLPSVSHLTCLQFWQAGLTDAMLVSLTNTISLCSNLRSVTLEGNALPEQSYHQLLNEDILLSSLSLRNNRIGDEAARLIGQALSTSTTANKTLLTLNLAFNCIGDVGAGYLAKGLRFNRTLLFLSLCNNQIGDSGAIQLTAVLSEFPLTHEEIKERRKMILVKIQAMCPEPDLSGDQRVLGKEKSRTHFTRSEHGTASKKDEKLAEGKDKALKKTGGTKVPPTKPGGKGGKEKPTPAVEDKVTFKEQVELVECPGSLLDLTVHSRDENLYFHGNKTLASLNLAGNKITEQALPSILKSLEKTEEGSSLVRLCLQRNKFPADCESHLKIKEFMQSRNDKDSKNGNEIKEEDKQLG